MVQWGFRTGSSSIGALTDTIENFHQFVVDDGVPDLFGAALGFQQANPLHVIEVLRCGGVRQSNGFGDAVHGRPLFPLQDLHHEEAVGVGHHAQHLSGTRESVDACIPIEFRLGKVHALYDM